jgi:hypothetical protein
LSIKYDITPDCIKIYDSYKINNKKMMSFIVNDCLKKAKLERNK